VKAERTANEQKIEAEKQKQVALAAKVEAQKQEKDAVAAKVEAENQRRDAVSAKSNIEAKNRELGSLLEEAARSDRLVAQEKLQAGEDAEALAYLARASRYAPKSSLSAEAAIPIVFSTSIQHSRVTFQGHSNRVRSAVFSPDGRRVLTASGGLIFSEDNTARLWEAESGKLLATFQGHTNSVSSAVFSPDGRRVLTASNDSTARLWEAESGKLLAAFQGHTDVVTRVLVQTSKAPLPAVTAWMTEPASAQELFKGRHSTKKSSSFASGGT
jgi:dipeptidyl aminopeptidase/acylaminoacyl peptidase